jgi:hypothetical protein
MSDKYSKSKIYTIRCKSDNSLVYVGSTIETLSQRFARHKRVCFNEKERGYSMILYQSIREKGWENFYIELYEDFPCERKEQLNKREGEIIREIGTLNSKISGRTKQEGLKDYYQLNKEKWFTEEAINKRKEYMQTDKYKECKKKSDAKHRDDRREYLKEYRNKMKLKNSNII